MYMKVMDEKLIQICQLSINKGLDFTKLKKVSNVNSIDEVTVEVLNNLNYSVAVYSFIDNSSDVYVSFLNNSIMNRTSLELENIKGICLSDLIDNDDENLLFIKNMQKVYDTGISQKLFFEFYKNDMLYKRFDVKIIKAKDFLFVICRDTADYSLLSMEQEKLFGNDINAMVIIQDECFIKCNKRYLELIGCTNYADIIGKKVGYKDLTNNYSVDLLENINKVLKEKLSSYIFPLEITKNGTLFRYFNLNLKYIIYNDKPAVLGIETDLTEQEITKRERDKKARQASFFQRNLELLQSTTDTGVSYQFDKKFIHSSKFYELIEREPIIEDSSRNILTDFVIDEDKHILEENYAKLKSGQNNVNFIIRINTAKGNLKYIHYYLKVKQGKDRMDGPISFYRDVTEEQIYLKDLKEYLKKLSLLKEDLELTQKISKTAMSYVDGNGIVKWTKSMFNILKLDSEQYKNYNKNFFDFILTEDLHCWYDAYDKCSPDFPESSTIIRFLNGEGNIAYIKCFIICTYDIKGNENRCITLYQDVSDQLKHENELKNVLNNSKKLEQNLEKIQKVSKTALCYVDHRNEDNLVWFNKGYNILDITSDEYLGTMDSYLIPEDKYVWVENHAKCTPENPETSFIQRIISGKGVLKYIRTFVAFEFDENGNRISHVNLYQDITKEIEQENELKFALNNSKKLEQNLEKIQKVSKTALCYVDHRNEDNLVWFNKGYNILDITSDEYLGTMDSYLIPEDKYVWVENHAKCTPENPETSFIQRIISGKGVLKYIKTFVAFEFDENGNKISHVNLYQDITKEVEEKKELKESLSNALKIQRNIDRIQASSKIAISYSDGMKYFKWTPEIFNILEINSNDYKRNMYSLMEQFVIEEDLKVRKKCFSKLSPKNPDIEFNQRIKTAKGNIKYIRTRLHHDYDSDGNLIYRSSFNQDITRDIKYQNHLEAELKDKKILLAEVHHRVKNNLQILLSLINLNKNYESKPETILANTENRIYAMALLHEKIYGSSSLSKVDIKDYLESLVNSLFDIYWSDINFHSDIDSYDMNMEKSIPLGLILNELTLNTIKYAFISDKEGNFHVSFKKQDKKYILIVKDDGVGLPDDIDLNNLTSLGLIVVQNLTLQIGGTFSLYDCDGAGFKIEFDEE